MHILDARYICRCTGLGERYEVLLISFCKVSTPESK